jgi:hypothetical protein
MPAVGFLLIENNSQHYCQRVISGLNPSPGILFARLHYELDNYNRKVYTTIFKKHTGCKVEMITPEVDVIRLKSCPLLELVLEDSYHPVLVRHKPIKNSVRILKPKNDIKK